jgi:hypothetical protein
VYSHLRTRIRFSQKLVIRVDLKEERKGLRQGVSEQEGLTRRKSRLQADETGWENKAGKANQAFMSPLSQLNFGRFGFKVLSSGITRIQFIVKSAETSLIRSFSAVTSSCPA